MNRVLALLLLACLGMGFIMFTEPAAVYACSCAEPQPVSVQFEHSDAVFVGEVLEVQEKRTLNGRITKAALFEVDRIWKGGTQSQVIIHTGSGGGDCGIYFEQGQDYLVYARHSNMYGDEEQLVTIMCDRTSEVAAAQEDITLLGGGSAPTEQVNLKQDLTGGLSVWVWILAAIAAVAGVALALLRWKVKR